MDTYSCPIGEGSPPPLPLVQLSGDGADEFRSVQDSQEPEADQRSSPVSNVPGS